MNRRSPSSFSTLSLGFWSEEGWVTAFCMTGQRRSEIRSASSLFGMGGFGEWRVMVESLELSSVSAVGAEEWGGWLGSSG